MGTLIYHNPHSLQYSNSKIRWGINFAIVLKYFERILRNRFFLIIKKEAKFLSVYSQPKKEIYNLFKYDILISVMMDKLLRTCDIENIYLLIRSKKGKDVHSRIEEIFDDPVSLLFRFFKNQDQYLINGELKSPALWKIEKGAAKIPPQNHCDFWRLCSTRLRNRRQWTCSTGQTYQHCLPCCSHSQVRFNELSNF